MGRPAGPGLAVDTLITPNNVSPKDPRSWTAADLRAKLLGRRNDLVYLAGHFSANSALAADFETSVLSTELPLSGVDLTNTIVFSTGCHSGYNIDDVDVVPGVTVPLDWAQAFTGKGATLIAGTGYQYGDTDFLEYSERIYAGFAEQLRTGSGPVSIGQALTRAKQAYLRDTPDVRGLHRKSLIQSVIFGLPMLAVNMPSGRIPVPTDTSIVPPAPPTFTTDPGLTLGLSAADVNLTDAVAPVDVPLTGVGTGAPTAVTATYFRGPNGVVVNPAEPALPLINRNVSVPNRVLRGVGFRGGAYTDSTLLPLTGAAATEIRGVHAPFTSPVFFPMRIATVNHLDALTGGSTRLMVTPVQHKAIDGSIQSTARVFSNVGLRLFYSGNITQPALSAPPAINGISAVTDGSDVVFSAEVTGNPAAGIQQVWVTYTGDAPRWTSLDLQQCVVTPSQALPAGCGTERSTRWIGRLAGAAPQASVLRFVVQAVNGVGLVTLDDALGAYHRVVTPGAPSAPPAAATQLTLSGVPASATFGSTIPVTATLTSGGTPLPGRSVIVGLGTSGTPAVTDANGQVTVPLAVNVTPGPGSVRASFAGVAGQYLASDAVIATTVEKSPTTLELVVDPTGATVTLRETARGGPLASRSVSFVITGPALGAPRVVPVNTNLFGVARLAPLGLPAGSYTVRAQFLGVVPPSATALNDVSYLGSSAESPLVVPAAADLRLTGVPPSGTVVTGSPVTISFIVSNNGPDAADAVVVTSTLPATFGSASSTTSGCAISASVLTCAIGAVNPSGTSTVTVTGTPTAAGPLTIQADVVSTTADPTPSDNRAIVELTVASSQVRPSTPTVNGPASVTAGSLYTATASSTGNPEPTYAFAASPRSRHGSRSTRQRRDLGGRARHRSHELQLPRQGDEHRGLRRG